LRNRDDPVDRAERNAPFLIVGPRDVLGLQPSAITGMMPPPGSSNAETTKLVYVQFQAVDLPWRYTPERAAGLRLRPWIVLIVGTTDEIRLEANNTIITFCAAVADAHPLDQSARWAHVQDDGQRKIARLLSPRGSEPKKAGETEPKELKPDTEYIAAVVPAFDANGARAWEPGESPTLPCYHHWRFRTAREAGDFRSLALRLKPGAASPDPERVPLGGAPLSYRRLDPPKELSVRGALAPIRGTDEQLPQLMADDVARLIAPRQDPRGRPIVTLPIYGAPWVAPRVKTAWGDDVNDDPRHRGATGLGMWAGIELQEQIMDAAAQQVGALDIAAQRIRQVTLGLNLSRSLWERRRPHNPAQRLLLYGPSLRRIVTPNGPVLDQIAAGERPLGRPLPRRLFSSAARRVLRPGPARTALAGEGATTPGRLLEVANRCPPSPEFAPDGLPHADLVAEIQGRPNLENLIRAGPNEEPWRGLGQVLSLVLALPELPCQPVDLRRLEPPLTEAIDPTVAEPLVQRRVLDGITGLDDQPLAPVEVCVGIDLPVWTFLRDRAPDWLLPGVGELEEDTVVALKSNPTFVDAFLLGLNTQVLSELRWRNIPVTTGCTPMRMFWGQVDLTTNSHKPDIRGVETWPATSHLGDRETHQQPPPTGDDLVLVFRSELFRRYPKTLPYLTPDPRFEGGPRLLPTFQGGIGEDIVFFRFGLKADERALDWWVVLEEPPSGWSFRNDVLVDAAINNGADFAKLTFKGPIRLLRRVKSLIEEI